MKKIVCRMFAVLLLLLPALASAAAVVELPLVVLDWSGTYTGQVDSNQLPFGHGVFESNTPVDGDQWHYVGEWLDGLFDGEGAIYYSNGMIEMGVFSAGVLTEGTRITPGNLTAELIRTEASGENEKNAEVQYIGNKKSKKFHLPTCRAVKTMKETNQVEFFSRQEAIQSGYEPCGECNP